PCWRWPPNGAAIPAGRAKRIRWIRWSGWQRGPVSRPGNRCSAAAGPGGAGGPVFARCYAHAGMVRLDGEKMSKSRGNLVFVSRLLAAGNDPMAIRLAIIAHHYAEDWDWTEQGL